MSLKKKKKVVGLLVFSIGLGILLAITMPLMGWIFLSAIALIYAGIYLYKN
ncbi:MAG TPA: hypothetical protein GX498_02560 [Clostridiales bacterium]|nr:hypothetical protein [Clostridiales bacterium]